MAEEFKIGPNPIDDPMAVDRAKIVLIGIADEIHDGGYKEGQRNDLSVDFSIACKCLDIDPHVMVKKLELSSYELTNMDYRIRVIDDYIDSWADSANIWNFGILDYQWIKKYDSTEDHYLECIEA